MRKVLLFAMAERVPFLNRAQADEIDEMSTSDWETVEGFWGLLEGGLADMELVDRPLGWQN